jgi:hypothetical protein
MAVKLHRCPNIWVKLPGHPCWRVQKALDDQGVDYEIVKEEWRGDRANTVEHTGEKKYPWIEFDDGSVYREESKDMAETIRAGRLNEKRGTGSPASTSPWGSLATPTGGRGGLAAAAVQLRFNEAAHGRIGIHRTALGTARLRPRAGL